jgi:hypothetical protein
MTRELSVGYSRILIVGPQSLWMLGTVLVYIAAIVLFFQFSWFGHF